MKEASVQLRNWVINKIKTEYAQDVDLLISVKGHSVNGDDHGEEFDFFIPATERACTLAETFIIGGIGHDLYPRSWERMEQTANLEHGEAYIIGNSEIIYSRNENAVRRYEELCKKMHANLNNPVFAYIRTLEDIDAAMNICKTLLFEETFYQIRLGAGWIMKHLNDAVSYLNGTYMPQKDSFEVLRNMTFLPEQFMECEEKIIQSGNGDEIKVLSVQLIKTTRSFALSRKPETTNDTLDSDLQNLADWYQELSLCWQRIYFYCQTGDYQNAFSDAVYLQSELNIVGTEFHLKEMDLLSAYNYNDLSELARRAKELEEYILLLFTQNTIKLNRYSSLQEFLEVH